MLRSRGKEPLAQWQSIGLFLIGTFSFAWLLWGYWVVAMPAGGLIVTPAFIACAIIGGFAPSLAAIVTSWLESGRSGALALLGPARRSVRLREVLPAIGIVPAATVVAWFLQMRVGIALQWPDSSLLAMALVWPIMAALGEEFGWRGFLLARLAPAWGLLPAAVVIGLVWGLWHLPADYVGLKGYGDWFWVAFLINGPIVLTAHSIIVSWLWQRSHGSILVALLYHWSITVSAIVAPTGETGQASGLVAAAIGAAAIWVVAAGLLAFNWRTFLWERTTEPSPTGSL